MTAEPLPAPQRTLLLLTALALILGVLALKSQPDGRLHIIAIATDGDAFLVQTPRGQHILIDGGADPAALSTALGAQLPFYKRSLDAVLLTLTDRTHLAGQVAALQRYRANFAVSPPIVHASPLLREWQRLLVEQQTPVRPARNGMRLTIDEVVFSVLSVGNGDEDGMIVRVDYRATSAVLAHAGGEVAEEELANRVRPASLVAFPWQRDPHTAFLEALAPSALMLTDGFVAEKPLLETSQQRMVGGERLYHEDLHGTITWTSDGRRAYLTTERAWP